MSGKPGGWTSWPGVGQPLQLTSFASCGGGGATVLVGSGSQLSCIVSRARPGVGRRAASEAPADSAMELTVAFGARSSLLRRSPPWMGATERIGMTAKRLGPGDTIGIASPSWGGPAVFPHRLDNGIAYLESRGFQVEVAPHARGQDGFVSGTAAERTADLHDLSEIPR